MKLLKFLNEMDPQSSSPISIKYWLDMVNVRRYIIRSNGVVDVAASVELSEKELYSIPIQFGRVQGDFSVSRNPLKSLQGSPTIVDGCFNCNNTQIQSLVGSPVSVGEYFSADNTNIKSLQNIHKIIKQIGTGTEGNSSFYCNTATSHLLGLLLIPGIGRIIIDNNGPVDKIMNKYIGKPNMIIEAQDELIDAGFKEQAKL